MAVHSFYSFWTIPPNFNTFKVKANDSNIAARLSSIFYQMWENYWSTSVSMHAIHYPLSRSLKVILLLQQHVYQDNKKLCSNHRHVIFPLPLPNVSTEGIVRETIQLHNDDQSTSFCRDKNLFFFFMGIGAVYFSTLFMSRDTRIFSEFSIW